MHAKSYPSEFAEKLWQGLSGSGKRAKEKSVRGRIPMALPSKEILLEISEVVYHASFTTEEGRPVRSRVGYFDDLKSEGWENNIVGWLPFQQRSDFNASVLNKIAPAIHTQNTVVAVSLSAAGRLEVVGIVRLRTWIDRHSAFSFWSDHYFDVLNIESQRPGHLLAKVTDIPYLELEDGEWKEEDLALPTILQRMVQIAERTLAHETSGEDSCPTQPFKKVLAGMLYNIELQRHGGTVLLIPEHEVSSSLNLLKIKYTVGSTEGWRLASRLVDITNASLKTGKPSEIEQSQLAAANQSLEEYIDQIAKLADVDGAVVLDTRLRLIGFGAEIQIESLSQSEFPLSDANGMALDPEHYGTRHRSAFRFVNSCPHSVAFIISSDGESKVVVSEGGQVIMTKPSAVSQAVMQIPML